MDHCVGIPQGSMATIYLVCCKSKRSLITQNFTFTFTKKKHPDCTEICQAEVYVTPALGQMSTPTNSALFKISSLSFGLDNKFLFVGSNSRHARVESSDRCYQATWRAFLGCCGWRVQLWQVNNHQCSSWKQISGWWHSAYHKWDCRAKV